MGGPTPSTRASPRLYCRPEEHETRGLRCPEEHEEPLPFRQDWVYGETTMRPVETSEGDKRLPLYDFRILSPTFLGGLDSRLLEFYSRVSLVTLLVIIQDYLLG